MIKMNKTERLIFVSWRDPQYQGPFSTVDQFNRRWTWIPKLGILSAFCKTAQNSEFWGKIVSSSPRK
jgi:hypothetical protein